MDSDEALMRRYLSGDREAFRQLYERYNPRLRALMRRQLRDEHDGQELVQQTFLQFHRARFDFKTGARVKPWLYTIALNLRRDHLRRLGRARHQVPLEDAPEPSVEAEDPARKQEMMRLREAVAALPEKSRAVIELHWFEGLSFAEVAQVLGLGLSAVKTRAHRAYKDLRAQMESDHL